MVAFSFNRCSGRLNEAIMGACFQSQGGKRGKRDKFLFHSPPYTLSQSQLTASLLLLRDRWIESDIIVGCSASRRIIVLNL